MAHCNVDLQVIAQDSPLRQPQGPIWHRQAPHLGHLCVRSKNASMLPGQLCHCRYAIARLVGWRHLWASLSSHLFWLATKPLFLLSTTTPIHAIVFVFPIFRHYNLIHKKPFPITSIVVSIFVSAQRLKGCVSVTGKKTEVPPWALPGLN